MTLVIPGSLTLQYVLLLQAVNINHCLSEFRWLPEPLILWMLGGREPMRNKQWVPSTPENKHHEKDR